MLSLFCVCNPRIIFPAKIKWRVWGAPLAGKQIGPSTEWHRSAPASPSLGDRVQVAKIPVALARVQGERKPMLLKGLIISSFWQACCSRYQWYTNQKHFKMVLSCIFSRFLRHHLKSPFQSFITLPSVSTKFDGGAGMPRGCSDKYCEISYLPIRLKVSNLESRLQLDLGLFC